MFTGLIEALGTVVTAPATLPLPNTSRRATRPSTDRTGPAGPVGPASPINSAEPASLASPAGRLVVTLPFPVTAGESVAVNGTCLTATVASHHQLHADVMDRTRSSTTLGQLVAGDQVNLERAVLPTTRLGGHLVQGHVDGTAVLIGRRRAKDPGTALELTFAVDPTLARFTACRGSITLDGVSLTIADCARDTVTVGLIPTTAEATTLGRLQPGRAVNVEIDVLARYLQRLLQTDPSAALAVAPPRTR